MSIFHLLVNPVNTSYQVKDAFVVADCGGGTVVSSISICLWSFLIHPGSYIVRGGRGFPPDRKGMCRGYWWAVWFYLPQ